MTQDQGLAGLLGRVEEAESGTVSLSFAIWKALIAPNYSGTAVQAFGPNPQHHLTASLDAALALCTRVLPGCLWRIEKHTPMPNHADETTFWATCGLSGSQEQAYGYTAPIAILAALLKALISKSSESGEGDRASQSQNGCAPKSATSDAEPSGQ